MPPLVGSGPAQVRAGRGPSAAAVEYHQLQQSLSRPRAKGEPADAFRNRIAYATALHHAYERNQHPAKTGALNYFATQTRKFADSMNPLPIVAAEAHHAALFAHPLRNAGEILAGDPLSRQLTTPQGQLQMARSMLAPFRHPIANAGAIGAMLIPMGPHGAGAAEKGALRAIENAKQLDLRSEAGHLGPLRPDDPVVGKLNSMLGPGEGKRLPLPNLPYTDAHGPLDRNGVPLMAYNYPPPVEQFYQAGYLADFLRGIPNHEVETRLDMLQQELNKEHWNLRVRLGYQFPTNLSLKQRYHPYIFEPRVEDMVRRGLKRRHPRSH